MTKRQREEKENPDFDVVVKRLLETPPQPHDAPKEGKKKAKKRQKGR